MTTMLVVDTTTRELDAWTASVTRAQAGFVIRLGAEVGTLESLTERCGSVNMPVLLVGDGYQARSSAGFVSVLDNHWRAVDCPPVIAVLNPDKGFRVRPQAARLLPGGTVWFEKVHTFSNSNPASAEAAIEGIKLMSSMNPDDTFVVEGQSDRLWACRIHSSDRDAPSVSVTDISPEHRVDQFTLQAVLRRRLGFAQWLEESHCIHRGYILAQDLEVLGQDAPGDFDKVEAFVLDLVARLEAEASAKAEAAAAAEAAKAAEVAAEEERPEWERALLEINAAAAAAAEDAYDAEEEPVEVEDEEPAEL